MTGMRLLGLILLAVCAASVGFWAAGLLGRRVRELEAAEAALDAMEGAFTYSLTPPDRAVARLAEQSSLDCAAYLAECDALCREGTPFPRAWRRAVQSKPGTLNRRDTEILGALADTLGQSDLDGQTAALAHARGLLRVQLEEARAQSEGRGKLYRTLGLLCGVFLFILWV